MENSGNYFPINISNFIGVQRERSKSLALASYHQSSSNSVFREKIFKFLMVHSKQNLPETPDTRFAGLKKNVVAPCNLSEIVLVSFQLFSYSMSLAFRISQKKNILFTVNRNLYPREVSKILESPKLSWTSKDPIKKA